MNSFARYRAVIDGETPDFLPRVPILMQFAAEYIGSDYGAFASDYRVLVEANERCAVDFGVDQLSCISDPYRETQGFGGVVEYRTDGPPRCTQPLETSKDLTVLETPNPRSSERMADRVAAAEAYASAHRGEYSILGGVEGPAAEAADLRGVTSFLIDLIQDEAFAVELMDRCTEVAIDFARAQIRAGADTIGIGDAIASQVGRDLYERLIQPREKRIVDAIREAGAWSKLHICGDITHLLPGIGSLGVDILDVDHMVSMTGVRKAVGTGVVITGNVDPVAVVLQQPPEEIRRRIAACYREVGDPYMVNAGCEIPSGTPVDSLLALCEPIDDRTAGYDGEAGS